MTYLEARWFDKYPEVLGADEAHLVIARHLWVEAFLRRLHMQGDLSVEGLRSAYKTLAETDHDTSGY